MMFRLRAALPLLIALMFCPGHVWAHEEHAGGAASGEGNAEAGTEFNTEHIFGFVDGSDIGEKGEKEIESNSFGHFGRIGSYANSDSETSFRYTVTDSLRISFGTLTDYYNIHNVPGFANLSAASFSGIIGELRFNVLNRQTSPIGFSISLNPQWRQFDPASGARMQSYAIPLTFLADKELIPEKLIIGSSFAFGPSFQRVGGSWEHDDALTATASASYQIVKNVFFAGEIRHENVAINGDIVAHALYVGPSVLYRILPNLDLKVAWAAQVPDFGARSLDLTTYDRHQVLLHLAYSF